MKRSAPAVLLLCCLAAAACSASSPPSGPPASAPATDSSTPSTAAASAAAASSASAPSVLPSSAAAQATTSAPCSTASVIEGWSVARRAAMLVSAPVLNYDLATVRAAAAAGVGGILFLGSASPPAGLSTSLKAALSGAAIPPLVMADEEGGAVQRLAGAVERFSSERVVAQTLTVVQAQSLAEQVGRQTLALGIDVDLMPVLDVDGGPGPSATNPDGTRSFSAVPATAAAYGLAYVEGLRAAGVLPVVKHFPGLGGSSGNTDNGPASTVPLASLRTGGLAPFRAAVAAGAPAVMVANAAVPGLTTLPASLSQAAVTGLLRTTLRFSGLVLTDSLSAGAVTSAGYDLPRAAVTSIEAGTDLVLFGSTLTAADTARLTPDGVRTDVAGIVAAVEEAVSAGTLTPARLDQAVEHVVAASKTDVCAG